MRQLNFSGEEILETIEMVRTEQLDIRTITVGISLFDCVSGDADTLCRNIFEKVTRVAKDLHRVSADLTREFGLPIINNRIAVTPVSLIAGKCSGAEFARIAETLDRAARDLKVDFIGGFSASVEKGMSAVDTNLIAALPAALAATQRVCASINVGSTRAGLNMDAIAEMGHVIRRTAELTAAAARSAAPSSWCSATRSKTTRSWPAPSTARPSRTASSTSASAGRAWSTAPSRRRATSTSAP